MKKLFEYLLVIGLLSPLLFINIRDSHDWGDDFAGYVGEAKNMAEGKAFYQSKFEYHDYNPSYCPPYYSYGFPMLLSPVIKKWGVDFRAMDRYMSLWLVAWALLVFYYLRKNFSLFTSVAVILIFFLNPYFFDFKSSVISDLPFSFFFLLLILLYQQRSGKPVYYQIIAGLVFALTVGIRGMGIVFLPIIFLDLIVKFFSSSWDEMKTELKESGIILGSAGLFIFLFNNVLFKTPSNLTVHFLDLFQSGHYWDVVLKNLDIYTNEFLNLFYHNTGKYSFSVHYTQAFMLVLFVVGFLNAIASRYRFEIWVLIIFAVTILLFPFSTQGFRYLLPVLPFIIYCVITGAKAIQFKGYNTRLLAFIFVVFVLLQYKKDIHAIRQDQHNPFWPGPYTWDSKDALDHIRSTVPDDALIASLKPRAIELLTDKRTCVLPAGMDIAEVSNKLTEAKPVYLLSIKVLGPKVDEVAVYRKDSLIWENAACRLYLCNKKDNR
jgi:hypothetical protein